MSATRDLGVKQAWATPFYQRVWADHDARRDHLISHLRQNQLKDGDAIASGIAPTAKSRLYESQFDLFADPALAQLVAFIDETLRVSVSHVNGGTVPPEQLHVSFDDSWCHITNDGGFHDAHYHPGCSWCGIYYLQVGDSNQNSSTAPNGGSRFYSPLATGGMCRDYGNHYRDVTSLDPPIRDGLLILFPSYLLHSGLPYRGAEDRIVIAFNSRILQNI
ncbi:hypothetical protein BH11PLA2_BH11PLA2_02730 [soil metagenome]